MKIAYIHPVTTLDYPGEIASVIYTQGCNFSCKYCYNKCLIPKTTEGKVTDDAAIAALKKYRSMIDAVVITGGEPTIQENIVEFVTRIKMELGLKVKLNTNGSTPIMLRRLMQVVDYISMDIKAPFHKYTLFSKPSAGIKVHSSFTMLLDHWRKGLDFRTTYDKSILSEEDVQWIINQIDGKHKYIIQPCKEVYYA